MQKARGKDGLMVQRGGVRRGFTLPEVLVTVAIVSLLAAVLIPAVTGQISKGDVGRVVQDLSSVQTGIQQFVADVHRYPGKLHQLTVKPTTTEKDISQSAYTTALVGRWKGPYVGADTTTFGATSGCVTSCIGLPTALGAVMIDSLVKYTNATQGVDYVMVRVFGLGQVDFNRIDEAVDGNVGATTGLLRWFVGTAGTKPDTTWYLAVPIQ